jgi:hypothetical protein
MGLSKITKLLFSSEIDSGIVASISFDGGINFNILYDAEKGINYINKELYSGIFEQSASIPRIVVCFKFSDNILGAEQYTIKVCGNYANLLIGTTLHFTNSRTKNKYSTNVGEYGRYSISLPRGVYDVSFNEGKNIILLDSGFVPESIYPPVNNAAKELTIESLLKDVDWADFALFDTFEDVKKIDETKSANFLIDVEGNLSDGHTNQKVAYWALLMQ